VLSFCLLQSCLFLLKTSSACAMQQMADCPSTFVQLWEGYRHSCLDKYDIIFISFTEAFILLSKLLCTELQYHHPRWFQHYHTSPAASGNVLISRIDKTLSCSNDHTHIHFPKHLTSPKDIHKKSSSPYSTAQYVSICLNIPYSIEETTVIYESISKNSSKLTTSIHI